MVALWDERAADFVIVQCGIKVLVMLVGIAHVFVNPEQGHRIMRILCEGLSQRKVMLHTIQIPGIAELHHFFLILFNTCRIVRIRIQMRETRNTKKDQHQDILPEVRFLGDACIDFDWGRVL